MRRADPDRLKTAVLAAQSGENRLLEQRLSWRERLTSLWTPVVVFVITLVPYVVLVQFWYGAHTWAQPAIKGFGLMMLGWMAALAVFRLLRREQERLRKLRLQAADLLHHLDREVARLPPDSRRAARERWLEPASRLEGLRVAGDEKRLTAELDRLSGQADKQFEGWRRRATWDGVRGLLLTLMVVLALRTLVVEPFRIPSGSMLPTLEIGDHVVVNRFIYGVRIPWLNVVPFPIVRRPRAGDVIVFNNPLQESDDFIKRVVAVEGDRVELADEVLLVNGVVQPRTLLDPAFWVWNREGGAWRRDRQLLYEETLDGGPHAMLQDPGGPLRSSNLEPLVVPEGHVFVLGDNRDNSADSRLGFGVPGHQHQIAFVPYGHIKGKAMIVWLSLGYGGVFSGITGGAGLRTDRLFLPVR